MHCVLIKKTVTEGGWCGRGSAQPFRSTEQEGNTGKNEELEAHTDCLKCQSSLVPVLDQLMVSWFGAVCLT